MEARRLLKVRTRQVSCVVFSGEYNNNLPGSKGFYMANMLAMWIDMTKENQLVHSTSHI